MKKNQSTKNKLSGMNWLLGIIFGLGIWLTIVFAQSRDYQIAIPLLWGFVFLMILILMHDYKKKVNVHLMQLSDDLESLMRNELSIENAETASEQSDPIAQLKQQLERLTEHVHVNFVQIRKISQGNFDVLNENNKDLEQLEKFVKKIQGDFIQLERENLRLLNHIEQHDYSQRIEMSQLSEGAIRVIAPINQMLDYLEDQLEWLEGVFDAIPYPIHVIDNELRWKDLNQSLVTVMQMGETITNKESAIGMCCSASSATICDTEDCGIRRFREKGLTSTSFEEFGFFYRMDVAPIINKKGEQIGYVEIGLDVTALERLNVYVKESLYKFGHSLVQLAEGNLEIELSVAAADEYTTDMHDFFVNEIASGLGMVKLNVQNLIGETSQIIAAIRQGELSVRADENKFQGAWKDLIHGLNRIVEEIDGPITEVAEVMGEIARGNLKSRVQGSYLGRFNTLKESINATVGHFNEVVIDIEEKLGNVAVGNMNIDDAYDYDGDFINVSRAINTIITSLNEMIGEFKNAVEQVNSGAAQVSAGSQVLSQGSTEQASAIEELTASVTEIADQTRQNAKNSNLAKTLALTVMNNAENGNEQMNAMQESMMDINESSRDISKIIKVIDDIAFQTNILALNAAVEAARAGVHGKGFAVVAEEVRTLAARSADAARETTQLIEGTIKKVGLGTQIAGETGEALKEIVAGIEKVTDLITNIADASNEQATGIIQINQGIEQVAQVVQMNSATAQESAAASEELSGQAELLNQKINHFRLRGIH